MLGLATKCGVLTSSLEDLINGKVGIGVASKLGVVSSSLQQFVDGGTSLGLASHLGIMSSNLQELRNKLGEDGVKGFLIGLMIAANNNYQK